MTDKKNEIILIVGMHRSGTSVLSRLFNLLGYGLSKSQIGINKSNESGHWESRRLARLNDDILSYFGQTWESAASIPWEEVPDKVLKTWVEKAVELIQSDFGGDQPLVIKDPRLCRLLPVYSRAVEQMGFSPKFVIPVRNPLEVKESLAKRNEMSETHALMLWLRYVSDALTFTRDLKRCFVATDRLVEAPDVVVPEIISQLDLDPAFSWKAVKADIEKLLRSDRLHHEISAEELRLHPCSGETLSALYQSMRVLSVETDSKEALRRISKALEQFETAAPMVGPVIEDLVDNLKLNRDVLKQKDIEIETLSSNHERAREEAEADLQRVKSDHENQLAKLKEQHDSVAFALKTKKASFEDQKKAFFKQNGLLQEQKNEISREKEHFRQESRNLRSQMRSKDRELENLKESLKRTRRDLWATNDRLMLANDYLNELGTSTSWKITRPIRALKRILSGQPIRQQPINTRPPTSIGKPKPEKSQPAKAEEEKVELEKSVSKTDAAPVAAPVAAKVEESVKLPESSVSPDFDQDYYVQSQGLTEVSQPWAHYIKEGWKSGLDPSPTFLTNAYLASHPDIKRGNLDPLSHLRERYPDYFEIRRNRPRIGGSPKIAVLAANAGGYDTVREPEVVTPNTDYVLFTDADVPESSVWHAAPFEYVSHDPTRTARFVKTHPHLWFGDYDWVIWVDSNLRIVCDVRELLVGAADYDMTTWDHPLRSTWQEEVKACLARSKDEIEALKTQKKAYALERDIPKQLWETSVLVFNMKNHAAIEGLMTQWWAEILKHSKRDQIALPKAVGESGAKLGYLAPKGICMRTDHRFEYYRHNK